MMDCVSWIGVIFCVCAVGHSRGCVLTDPTLRVQEGSDVRLTCTFYPCPGRLDHTVHITWEFNDTAFFFYYENQSTSIWNNTECTGDVSAGYFSVLLQSVTQRHSGIYTCFVRPLNSRVIYKNHTVLTIAPSRSGRGSMLNSDPLLSSSLWLILGCCGAGLLVLAAGCMLGLAARWKRVTQRKEEGTVTSTEETQHPHKDKDMDCYVTLQKGKAPPPAPKEEGIYVTMSSIREFLNNRGSDAARDCSVPPGIQAQPGHNRQAIPMEWYAPESPPHVKNENLPTLHPPSSGVM